LDLSKYKTTPEDGAVVSWPENAAPAEKQMTFVVKTQLLKSKPIDPSSQATESVSRDEL
jgi:hypothetical protein